MTEIPQLLFFDEPEIRFGYDQQAAHPKEGLILFGPYNNPLGGSTLRIGLIATDEGGDRYRRWAKRISGTIAQRKTIQTTPCFRVLRQFSTRAGLISRSRTCGLMMTNCGMPYCKPIDIKPFTVRYHCMPTLLPVIAGSKAR